MLRSLTLLATVAFASDANQAYDVKKDTKWKSDEELDHIPKKLDEGAVKSDKLGPSAKDADRVAEALAHGEQLEREEVTKSKRFDAELAIGTEDFGNEDSVNWFNTVSGLPFFEENKQKIWEDATTDLQPLLQVCELGRECRAGKKTDLVTDLTSEWTKLITDFKSQV